MVNSIRQYLKEEGFHDSIALSTLLDELYDSDRIDLVEQIESVMEKENVSSTTRVSTFITKLNN